MLMIVEALLLIFGAIMLFTGKVSVGSFQVAGIKVRQAGIILMLPLVVGFSVGLIIGFNAASEGRDIGMNDAMGITLAELLGTIAAGMFSWRLLKQASRDTFEYEKVKTGMRYGSLSDFPSVMTLAETAYYLRTSEKEVLALIHDGFVPAAKMGGSYRISRQAVDEYLRQQHAV